MTKAVVSFRPGALVSLEKFREAVFPLQLIELVLAVESWTVCMENFEPVHIAVFDELIMDEALRHSPRQGRGR